MKKKLTFLIIVLSVAFIFAQDIPANISDELINSDLYAFSKKESEKEHKPLIEFSCISKEEFTRKTKKAMDESLLARNKENDYNDIKNLFKKEEQIYGDLWNSFSIFKWKEGKKFEFSIMYSQSVELPIHGAGVYVIRIFDNEYVYIIRLSDFQKLDEQNKEYESLNDIFEYKKGQKLDSSRGLEQTQGYYCSKESAFRVYEKLKQKDSALPKSARQFQEAEEFIEKILLNY